MKINFNKNELLPYQVLVFSYILVIFSYPMPPRPGMVEVLMGIGLSIGCLMLFRKYLQHAMWHNRGAMVSILAALALILYPLVMGLVSGNTHGNIIRDVFPMLFLLVLIPLVSYSVLQNEARKVVRTILGGILFVGIVSTSEFMVGAIQEYGSLHNMSASFSNSYHTQEPTDAPRKVLKEQEPTDAPRKVLKELDDFGRIVSPDNFSVMALHIFEPAVLFTAIFCGCLAMTRLSSRQFVQAAIFAVLSIITAYGMVVLRSRAPSFLWATMLMLFLSIMIARSNPKKRTRIVAIASVMLAVVIFFSWDLIILLIQKQMAVGLNGKNTEWLAVINTISKDSLHLLFGYGWGAEFYPGYQSFPARFTHSVVSFILLKSGVVGLFTFAAIYFQLIANFVRGLKTSTLDLEQWAIVLAAVATMCIGLILEPTYKMLGYSFIAILWLVSVPNSRIVKSNREL